MNLLWRAISISAVVAVLLLLLAIFFPGTYNDLANVVGKIIGWFASLGQDVNS